MSLAARMRCAVGIVMLTIGASDAQAPLGTVPLPGTAPQLVFAFEFRVTLAPATVVGQTAFGHRQYIPITGGRIAGPKFTGEVLPGGWDYQLGLPDGCSMLSADYFIRAHDGTTIHVLNEGLSCPPTGAGNPRSFFRPRFEAPRGPYEWLTRGDICRDPGTGAPGQAPAGQWPCSPQCHPPQVLPGAVAAAARYRRALHLSSTAARLKRSSYDTPCLSPKHALGRFQRASPDPVRHGPRTDRLERRLWTPGRQQAGGGGILRCRDQQEGLRLGRDLPGAAVQAAQPHGGRWGRRT